MYEIKTKNNQITVDCAGKKMKENLVVTFEGDGNDIRPNYTGEYEVTPSIEEKILSTRNKAMKKDVKIKSIPFYETTNIQNGITVYIG